MTSSHIHIGCAGWNVPKDESLPFVREGSHLEQYASVFNAVEINSSFYRPHRLQTYKRWAASVPENFRFSVKIPKQITHERRLGDVRQLLEEFCAQSGKLGDRLGCYLIQLPPSLDFQSRVVTRFLKEFRELSSIPAVCEPRHRSWFTPAAFELLATFQIGFVQADPSPVSESEIPTDFGGPSYLRLHGSPRIYYSEYSEQQLVEISRQLLKLQSRAADAWCIFDNTAQGAAILNALTLLSLVGREQSPETRVGRGA